MAIFIRQTETNDIFQLDNEDFIGFPCSMQMTEQDVEDYFNLIQQSF